MPFTTTTKHRKAHVMNHDKRIDGNESSINAVSGRPFRRFGIGEAIGYMRQGARVARAGWNGRGMYLFLVPGSRFTVQADKPMGKACPELVGQEIDYHAHIDMKTSAGYVVPWLASQADLLAEDWHLISVEYYVVEAA